MDEKFKFWQKWFWVGIIVSILGGPAGTVYGLALAAEPNLRREGWAIAIFSIIWTILVVSLVQE